MCTNTELKRQRAKRTRVRVQRLTRCGASTVEKDLELKNLKLYLENQCIIEENEKLRKKASILHQENLALRLQIQKQCPLISSREPQISSSLCVHERCLISRDCNKLDVLNKHG